MIVTHDVPTCYECGGWLTPQAEGRILFYVKPIFRLLHLKWIRFRICERVGTPDSRSIHSQDWQSRGRFMFVYIDVIV